MRRRNPSLVPLLVTCALASGCAGGPERQITEASLLENFAAYRATYASDLELMDQRSEHRILNEYRAALENTELRQSYDVLLLSGGGAFGAFGAGFLSGWGEDYRT